VMMHVRKYIFNNLVARTTAELAEYNRNLLKIHARHQLNTCQSATAMDESIGEGRSAPRAQLFDTGL